MVDRSDARLRLQFWNRDPKTGRQRMVEQELVLAKGAGEWWFRVDEQIHERLRLRPGDTKFRPPQALGSSRKARRWPVEDKNDGREPRPWSRAGAARCPTKLPTAKLVIKQFLARIFDHLHWQAAILPITYAALRRISTTWQRSQQKMKRPLQSLKGAIVRIGSRLGVLDPGSPAV
jgi:hypothetical protein